MSGTYQLPPELSDRLEGEAARRNVAPEDLVQSLVHSFLASTKPRAETSPQGDAERFRRWAESHRRDIPVIALDAMSREQIYEERG